MAFPQHAFLFAPVIGLWQTCWLLAAFSASTAEYASTPKIYVVARPIFNDFMIDIYLQKDINHSRAFPSCVAMQGLI